MKEPRRVRPRRRPAASAPPLPADRSRRRARSSARPRTWRRSSFDGETLDARADQFSFCVALHEALHGQRPALAHLQRLARAADRRHDAASPNRQTGAPTWLRGVIARGLSDDRDDRFPSMDALLAAVSRGQRRGRQRTAGLGVGIAVALLAVGAWRLADARRRVVRAADRPAGRRLVRRRIEPAAAGDPSRVHRPRAIDRRDGVAAGVARARRLRRAVVRDVRADLRGDERPRRAVGRGAGPAHGRACRRRSTASAR